MSSKAVVYSTPQEALDRFESLAKNDAAGALKYGVPSLQASALLGIWAELAEIRRTLCDSFIRIERIG